MPRIPYMIDLTEDTISERQTYLMIGHPVLLPAGHYRTTLYLTASDTEPLVAEVIAPNTMSVHLEGTASQLEQFDFTSPGDAPLQFRLRGKAKFHDATIEYLKTAP